MKENPLEKGKYRVIKISRKALIEFIYESFMDNQRMYLETEPTETMDHFYIDLEKGCFICCAERVDELKPGFMKNPLEIDIGALCRNLEDTTDTMYSDGRYLDYTRDELILLSKRFQNEENELESEG